MRIRSILVLVFGASLLAPGAVLAAEDAAAPEASVVPVESEPGRRDLYFDMPSNMGEFEPEIVMSWGEEHFANLDADDQTRVELQALLDAAGADVEDMVSGYALVSQEDFFSFVVAIRIAGAEPGSMMPAYLPILYEDLVDPAAITGSVGGKDVVIISSIGDEDEYVELYVYDQGDTLWMAQGPTDVVEATLENLPGPMPMEGAAAE